MMRHLRLLALVLALLVSAQPASAAWAAINNCSNAQSGASGGPKCTLTTTGADLLVMLVFEDTLAMTVNTDVEDTLSNSWHITVNIPNANTHGALFWSRPSSTGSDTCQITASRSPFSGVLACFAFSGSTASNTQDGTAGTSASGNSPEAGPFATGTTGALTQTGDLLVCAFEVNTAGLTPVLTVTGGGGDGTTASGDGHTLQLSWDVASASSGQSRNWTKGGSANLGNFPFAGILAFSPGAGGGGATPCNRTLLGVGCEVQ